MGVDSGMFSFMDEYLFGPSENWWDQGHLVSNPDLIVRK